MGAPFIVVTTMQHSTRHPSHRESIDSHVTPFWTPGGLIGYLAIILMILMLFAAPTFAGSAVVGATTVVAIERVN